MRKYSSFICEHTAEYFLIPKFTNILKAKFEFVIPISPWLTREGSNLSKLIHRGDEFAIVGLYPRRPKLNLIDQKILVKINSDLLIAAGEAARINIPMIAGCPLGRNLWELNEDTKCVWIKLTDKTKDFYNIEYNLEMPTEYKIFQNEEVLDTNEDIINFIIAGIKTYNIEDLTQAVRTIRQHSSTSHYFMSFGNYKPAYFLLKNNDI